MKLKENLRQSRRDFTGRYECEGCGHTEERRGYDDRYFHDEVTPAMTCGQCGESTNSLGLQPQHVATRYASWEEV